MKLLVSATWASPNPSVDILSWPLCPAFFHSDFQVDFASPNKSLFAGGAISASVRWHFNSERVSVVVRRAVCDPGSSEIAQAHLSQFRFGHPVPRSSPPTSVPSASRFGSPSSGHLVRSPANSSHHFRPMASALRHPMLFRAWVCDGCRYVP